MKLLHLILLVLICFCLISCNQNENKAKKLVKKYLKENIDDWDSYEPAFWGNLDSVISTKYEIENIDYLSKLDEIIKWHADELASIEANFKNDPIKLDSQIQIANDNYTIKVKKLDSITQNDKKINIWVGWSLLHNYRSKNETGNKFISKKIFYFNKKLDSIVELKNN